MVLVAQFLNNDKKMNCLLKHVDLTACELLCLIFFNDTKHDSCTVRQSYLGVVMKKIHLFKESDIYKRSYRHLGIYPKYLPAFLFLSSTSY